MSLLRVSGTEKPVGTASMASVTIWQVSSTTTCGTSQATSHVGSSILTHRASRPASSILHRRRCSVLGARFESSVGRGPDSDALKC